MADEIGALISREEGAVLGLATGHTPARTYLELVRRVQDRELSFERATTFNLDEYAGLAAGHAASFRSFMRGRLFDRVDLDTARSHFLRGEVTEAEQAVECARYEALISEAGGIDLQLLGIGLNGHIGFNEPGSTRDSRTRRVELSEVTRAANRPDFPATEEVPRHALTMGIGTILQGRRLRLLAFGEEKAEIIAELLNGPISSALPASFLREHDDVELWLDEAAASALH